MITFATDNTVRLELKLTPPILLTILVALLLSRALYKSTLFIQNKPNLPDAQTNVSPFLTRDYENQRRLRTMKNKPNQTQSNPIQSQYKPNSRKTKMKLNFYSTKDYENEQLCPRRDINPIKPNFKPDTLLPCGGGFSPLPFYPHRPFCTLFFIHYSHATHFN
jgi:hypothetical protein